MSPAQPQPTEEQWQLAWQQVQRPGWPSLAELRQAVIHYGCVRGRAMGLARGELLPPVAMPLPQATTPPAPAPARRRYERATQPDRFDARAAAAGEFLHQDE